MRFPDFLRVTVLLFGGAATALAVVAIAGANAREDVTLLYIAVAWWVLGAVAGLYLGRSRRPTAALTRLMAGARTTPLLPELEPGAVLFNRLWSLFVVTVVAGAVAFLIPQIPAIACGYSIALALVLRKQASAVQAIEDRDGVRFYVDRTSPLKPTQLLRTPGFKKLDPGLAEAGARA